MNLNKTKQTVVMKDERDVREYIDDKTKKTQHNVLDGPHYTQTNTNNVNKTWALVSTTEGKGELNMLGFVVVAEIVVNITTRNSERKDT